MTELRVCSKCRKVFYTKGNEYSPPCTHCGYVLIERSKTRVKTDKDFSFTVNGEKRVATMKEYSEIGAKIVYLGKPIPINTSFLCNIEELNINSNVETIWTKKVNQSAMATGIRFL
ncbi:MAG: hypothetical protein KAJ10_04945 [Thermodesulfovibrionia bacterium]|jgi:predicted RNA-binding Zn-ribbon protein involved in translation (DUF1610 family)|nr:hypothetical protein [Thermodesulfovibrionia bacterium]